MKEEKIPLNTLMKILIFKKKNILIHVSSVGEFEQAKPIIDGLRSLNKFEIIVSFFLHHLKIKSRKINLFIIVFTFHPIQKKYGTLTRKNKSCNLIAHKV